MWKKSFYNNIKEACPIVHCGVYQKTDNHSIDQQEHDWQNAKKDTGIDYENTFDRIVEKNKEEEVSLHIIPLLQPFTNLS